MGDVRARWLLRSPGGWIFASHPRFLWGPHDCPGGQTQMCCDSRPRRGLALWGFPRRFMPSQLQLEHESRIWEPASLLTGSPPHHFQTFPLVTKDGTADSSVLLTKASWKAPSGLLPPIFPQGSHGLKAGVSNSFSLGATSALRFAFKGPNVI